MSDVTRILSQIECGDPSAAEALLPLIYDELRALAAAKMADESPDHTLQATALVHEAYIRLVDVDQAQHWNSRGHFFRAAAEAMRRILVEAARRKEGPRRGGEAGRRDIDLDLVTVEDASQEILEVHEALDTLAEEKPLVASLVELRYFGGLSLEDAARSIGISIRTASRYWSYARIWLHHEIFGSQNGGL
jgi:RNA polymerase sigma factor (TIGR02999 family)